MSRHRDIRNLDYDEEYDHAIDDEVYGHSLEDTEYGISPTTEEYLYSQKKDANYGFSAYFPDSANIKEEEEDEEEEPGRATGRRDSSNYERPRLSSENEMRLNSVLDEIRNVVGDHFQDHEMVPLVLDNDYDLETSLNALLNKKPGQDSVPRQPVKPSRPTSSQHLTKRNNQKTLKDEKSTKPGEKRFNARSSMVPLAHTYSSAFIFENRSYERIPVGKMVKEWYKNILRTRSKKEKVNIGDMSNESVRRWSESSDEVGESEMDNNEVKADSSDNMLHSFPFGNETDSGNFEDEIVEVDMIPPSSPQDTKDNLITKGLSSLAVDDRISGAPPLNQVLGSKIENNALTPVRPSLLDLASNHLKLGNNTSIPVRPSLLDLASNHLKTSSPSSFSLRNLTLKDSDSPQLSSDNPQKSKVNLASLAANHLKDKQLPLNSFDLSDGIRKPGPNSYLLSDLPSLSSLQCNSVDGSKPLSGGSLPKNLPKFGNNSCSASILSGKPNKLPSFIKKDISNSPKLSSNLFENDLKASASPRDVPMNTSSHQSSMMSTSHDLRCEEDDGIIDLSVALTKHPRTFKVEKRSKKIDPIISNIENRPILLSLEEKSLISSNPFSLFGQTLLKPKRKVCKNRKMYNTVKCLQIKPYDFANASPDDMVRLALLQRNHSDYYKLIKNEKQRFT